MRLLKREVVSKELRKCVNRYNRIKRVMDGSGKKMADLLDEQRINRSDPLTEKKNNSEVAAAGLVDGEDMESVEKNSSDYDCLLSLKPETSTLENLRAEMEKLEKLMEYLQPRNVKLRWSSKLEALEKELEIQGLRRDPHTKEEPSEPVPQKKAPSDNTRTETDVESVAQMPTEKQPIKRSAAKKPSSSVLIRGEKKKEDGGRKPAIGMKRRRWPASEQSQYMKVRKFRLSPFNRKSGSIPGRTVNSDDEEGDAPEASTSF